MSRTYHHNRGERRIRVVGVRKSAPDLRRIAKLLIELARAEAEQEAQSEHRESAQTTKTEPNNPGGNRASRKRP